MNDELQGIEAINVEELLFFLIFAERYNDYEFWKVDH